jgi:antitoxin HigA-1
VTPQKTNQVITLDITNIYCYYLSMIKRLNNIHPGEILNEEFLIPMEITAYRLAKETNLPQTAISDIIKGKRNITAQIALRFSKFFGTTPQFWMGLQDDYDLEHEKERLKKELSKIHTYKISDEYGRFAVSDVKAKYNSDKNTK